MDKNILKKILFNESDSINKVNDIFNTTAPYTNGKGFGLILDKSKSCVGVITDGDIRRNLKKFGLNSKINKIYSKKFHFVSEGFSEIRILKIFEKQLDDNTNFHSLPVLNKKKKVVDVLNFKDFLDKKKLVNPISVRVPARVSFSGGGIDFSEILDKKNTFVLSSTIAKYITVTVYPRKDKQIIIKNYSLGHKENFKDINELKKSKKNNLINNLLKSYSLSSGFEIELYSDFEIGTGLGGSSAITMAIITAIKLLKNERFIDNYELVNEAYKIERIESNIKGGWQDYYAIAFGGFNWIEFDKKNTTVNQLKIDNNIILELEKNLILFRIGSSRNSSNIQKKIKNLSKNKKQLSKIINSTISTSFKMKKSLLKGRLSEFGDLLHQSWLLKKKLNPLSTSAKIDSAYKLAISLGAKGGKILGAGQSGYLLLYADSEFHNIINKSLKNKKFLKAERVIFSSDGIQYWRKQTN
ncbi:CBS domain-containing protein [Candidatus Pelagibacter sp.]|nr:CBS domain-containing protein [Candidatus Pelagibacter sp.]